MLKRLALAEEVHREGELDAPPEIPLRDRREVRDRHRRGRRRRAVEPFLERNLDGRVGIERGVRLRQDDDGGRRRPVGDDDHAGRGALVVRPRDGGSGERIDNREIAVGVGAGNRERPRDRSVLRRVGNLRDRKHALVEAARAGRDDLAAVCVDADRRERIGPVGDKRVRDRNLVRLRTRDGGLRKRDVGRPAGGREADVRRAGAGGHGDGDLQRPGIVDDRRRVEDRRIDRRRADAAEREERGVRHRLVVRRDARGGKRPATQADFVVVPLERRVRSIRVSADRKGVGVVQHRIDPARGAEGPVRIDGHVLPLVDERQVLPRLPDVPHVDGDGLVRIALDGHLRPLAFRAFELPLDVPAVVGLGVLPREEPVPTVDVHLVKPSRNGERVAERVGGDQQAVAVLVVIGLLVDSRRSDDALLRNHLADVAVRHARRHRVESVARDVRLDRRAALVHVPHALEPAPRVSRGNDGSRLAPPVGVDDGTVRKRRKLHPDQRFASSVPCVDFARKDDSGGRRKSQVSSAWQEIGILEPGDGLREPDERGEVANDFAVRNGGVGRRDLHEPGVFRRVDDLAVLEEVGVGRRRVVRRDALGRKRPAAKADFVVVSVEGRVVRGGAAADGEGVAVVVCGGDRPGGAEGTVRVDGNRSPLEGERQRDPLIHALADGPDNGGAGGAVCGDLVPAAVVVPFDVPAAEIRACRAPRGDSLGADRRRRVEPPREGKRVAERVGGDGKVVVGVPCPAGVVLAEGAHDSPLRDRDHVARRAARRRRVQAVAGDVRLGGRAALVHVPDATERAPRLR